MTGPEKRKGIYVLHKAGMGVRALARELKLSRNTIRDIIRLKGETPTVAREGKVEVDPELLTRLNAKCKGRKQRVMEELKDEKEIEVKYSTLTRLMRKLGIGVPQDSRCDRVPDEPGAEMQHDTSPYRRELGGVPTKIVASILYLRYAKRRYLKFYRTLSMVALFEGPVSRENGGMRALPSEGTAYWRWLSVLWLCIRACASGLLPLRADEKQT